ncbi:MAG: DUF120 domain-containing protein [Candidatus Micrarchaeota archaeon]
MRINYCLMFALLRLGAHEKHLCVSTGELARILGVSQQTTSRWLIEFEKNRFISRDRSGLRLTAKSISELRSLSELILGSLDSKRKLKLKGTVISGMKDGKYYMGFGEYRKQFKQKLSFVPYSGTLNIKIDDLEAKLILADRKGETINGFSHGQQVLGDIKCFPCIIGKRIKCFVVLPSRSHYGLDVLELVSKDNLRKKLKLKDGDTIEFQIWLG